MSDENMSDKKMSDKNMSDKLQLVDDSLSFNSQKPSGQI
jgi:hypothetical protein